MSLKITVDTGTDPTPQVVADAKVKQQAKAQGSSHASHAGAITKPVLNIDQKLSFKRRKKKEKLSFVFNQVKLS